MHSLWEGAPISMHSHALTHAHTQGDLKNPAMDMWAGLPWKVSYFQRVWVPLVISCCSCRTIHSLFSSSLIAPSPPLHCGCALCCPCMRAFCLAHSFLHSRLLRHVNTEGRTVNDALPQVVTSDLFNERLTNMLSGDERSQVLLYRFLTFSWSSCSSSWS